MVTKQSERQPAPTLKAAKKRSDILKAAQQRFRQCGFHQTSMQEICETVGLGPGAVYRYFSSKQAIIEAMAAEERAEARSMLVGLRSTEHLPDALDVITRALATRSKLATENSLMLESYAEGLRTKRIGTLIKKAEAEWIHALAQLDRKSVV